MAINDEKLRKDFGEVLRQMRKAADLSREEAARTLRAPSHPVLKSLEDGDEGRTVDAVFYPVRLARRVSETENGPTLIEDLLGLLDPEYQDRKDRLEDLESRVVPNLRAVIPMLMDHLQETMRPFVEAVEHLFPTDERLAQLAREAFERTPGTKDPRLRRQLLRNNIESLSPFQRLELRLLEQMAEQEQQAAGPAPQAEKAGPGSLNILLDLEVPPNPDNPIRQRRLKSEQKARRKK